MAAFEVELTSLGRDGHARAPDRHGLVGVRDVDERFSTRARCEVRRGAPALFNMHAEGMCS